MKKIRQISVKTHMLGCSGMMFMISVGSMATGYAVYRIFVA